MTKLISGRNKYSGLTPFQIMGKTPGSDGNVWIVLPDNAEMEINVTAQGIQHYRANWGCQKYKAYFWAYVNQPNPGGPKWQVISLADRAGHAWWKLVTDAPVEGLHSVGLTVSEIAFNSTPVGYHPVVPIQSLLFPSTPGYLKYPDNESNIHVSRRFTVDFNDFMQGLRFTKSLYDTPGDYSLTAPHHCVSTTRDIGLKVGIDLPEDDTPQNFGIELEKFPAVNP